MPRNLAGTDGPVDRGVSTVVLTPSTFGVSTVVLTPFSIFGFVQTVRYTARVAPRGGNLRLTSVRERKVVIALVTVLALAALVGLRALDLWSRRGQILDAGDRRAENLALILAGYVRETFAA